LNLHGVKSSYGYLSALAFIETASAMMKAMNVRKRVARKQIADAAICSNIPALSGNDLWKVFL